MRDEHFVKVQEVIAIHLSRYDGQIQKLLQVKDYSKDEVISQKIDQKTFFRARERKIKAYNDCIATIGQKERNLQFHNAGFQLEIVEERIEIKAKSKYNVHLLSHEQLVKLYYLILKAKESQELIPSISHNQQKIVDKVLLPIDQINEGTNIDFIKQEAIPNDLAVKVEQKSDPTRKLKESVERLAVQKFKEAGATLTEEESQLL